MPQYTVCHAMDMQQTSLGVLTTDEHDVLTHFEPAHPDQEGMFDFEIAAAETLAFASSRLRLYQFTPVRSALDDALAKARARNEARRTERGQE